jgi:pantetheine-phosphate adenylyltransferase
VPTRTAIYPGSFDPITNGHIDVLDRAASLFDKVILAVSDNNRKKSLFTLQERVTMARLAVGQKQNIEIKSFQGLLVHFAKNENACAVIRGLRAVGDFEFEFQLALMNRQLAPGFETVFLFPKPSLMAISSTLVKEIASYGGDVSAFVHPAVQRALTEKFSKSENP